MLVAAAVVMAMASTDTLIVNVAMPSIGRDFAVSSTTTAWVVTAYMLTGMVFLFVGGRLGDSVGRRRTMIAGMAIFAAGAVVCGSAQNAGWLIAGRAVQGVGAGLMMPSSRAVVFAAYPREQWGRASGVVAAAATIGVIVGPLVGGALTDTLGWRAVFFLHLPLAAVGIAVTALAVAESRDPAARRGHDPAGLLLLTVGLSGLLIALLTDPGAGVRWALLGLALVALAGFVWVEMRSTSPIVELRALGSRHFLAGCLVKLACSFVLVTLLFFAVHYLQAVRGESAFVAGALVIPLMGTALVMAPIAGWLCDRLGPRIPLIGGMAALAVGLALLTLLSVSTPYWFLVPAFLIISGAGEILAAASTLAGMRAVDPGKAAQASAMLSFSRRVGGLVGIAVCVALFQALLTSRLQEQLPASADPSTSAAVRAALVDAGGATTPGPIADVGPVIERLADEAFASSLSTVILVPLAVVAAVGVATVVLTGEARMFSRVRRRDTGRSSAPESAQS